MTTKKRVTKKTAATKRRPVAKKAAAPVKRVTPPRKSRARVHAPKPEPMDAKLLLGSMADLFEKSPERFSQGAFARDKKGRAVEATDNDAHSFSVNGFFERALAEGKLDEVQSARAYDLFIGAVQRNYGYREMVKANDHEGREAVIKLARQAAQ